MARKHGHAKRHLIPKTTGGKIGLVFKIIGGVVVAGPALSAVGTSFKSGDWTTFPSNVLTGYTGYDQANGSINTGQLTYGVTSVVGGIGLVYLGKFLARTIR